MGKGDKKTRRGKIILGTSGVRRPRNKKKAIVSAVEKVADDVIVEKKPAKKAKKKEAEPTA
jgi:30S ribosomal protein S31